MHVQHSNAATATLGHGGREYTAIRPGVFDVPDEVGAELLGHPGWSQYFGEVPHEVGAAGEQAPTSGDWAEAGRAAAQQKLPRRVPDGLQPRSREARQFLAGYDEIAKAPQASDAEPGQREPAPAE